ncbi:MAG: hypothetical protein KJ668_18005 [Proteobacteria bacterium]|nr:hypothetical protein [Pseudomonadota bacterium]
MNLDKPAYKTHEQEVDRLKRQAVLAKNEIKALTYSQKELTAVLASTPLVIMLMDREKRVKMVSDAVLQFTHRKAENILGLRGGEVLRCVHHIDDPEGCGSGPACDTCIVRNTVTDTLTTRNSHHKVAATLSLMDDSVQERHLLVSTVFIAVPDESVIIFVEDVTDQKKNRNCPGRK